MAENPVSSEFSVLAGRVVDAFPLPVRLRKPPSYVNPGGNTNNTLFPGPT
jgi:hypothetical protein